MTILGLTPREEASPRRFPGRKELVDFRQPYLLPLMVLIATRLWFWRLLPYAAEDAYITFRYARNLVQGFGLTYNPGERVMGFSTPAWTLWNALGYALTHQPVLWSRATTLGLECAALLVASSMLASRCGRATAWCFAVFYAAWPYFAAVSASGMETGAMLALIILAAALAERRHLAAGPAIAIVGLMRPEGMFAGLLLGLGAGKRDRIVAAVAYAAGVAALWAYFGSPVPQSVIAKAALYGAPGPWLGRHWWEWICPIPMGAWPTTSEGGVLFAMAIVMAPAAALGVRALWSLRGTAVAGAWGACLVVWLAYVASGAAWFWWYLAVPLGGIAGAAAIGLPRLTRSRALYASLAAFVAGTWSVVPGLYSIRASAEWSAFGGAAEFLAANAHAGDTAVLEPIGMVGWRCRLIVHDEIGLVAPEIAARRLRGPGWMTDVIARERPDWIVVRSGVLRDLQAFAGAGVPFRGIAERDSLVSRYPLATTIGNRADGEVLEIRRRRDASLAPTAASAVEPRALSPEPGRPSVPTRARGRATARPAASGP